MVLVYIMEYITEHNLSDLVLLDKERKLFISPSTCKLVDFFNRSVSELTTLKTILDQYGYKPNVLHDYKNLANIKSLYRHNVPPINFGAYLAFINNYLILIIITDKNSPNLLLEIHRITIGNNSVGTISIPFLPQQNWIPVIVPAYIIPLPEENGITNIINLWTFDIVTLPLIITKKLENDVYVYSYNYEIIGIYPYMFLKIFDNDKYFLYSINDNNFIFQNAKWVKLYSNIITYQNSDDITVVYEPLETYFIYTYFHSFSNNEIIVYANRNMEEYEAKFNSNTYSGDISVLNNLLDKYLYDNKHSKFVYTENTITINLNDEITIDISKISSNSFEYKLSPMDSIYSFFQIKFDNNNNPSMSYDGITYFNIYDFNEI